MNNIKKILFSALALVFIPSLVGATENESYVEYSEIKAGYRDFSGWNTNAVENEIQLQFQMDSFNNYSFKLKGYNLDVSFNYVLEMTSDFMNYSHTYTGEELMNGIKIERNDGKGTIYSKVYLESSQTELKSKYISMDDFVDKVYFKFNEGFDPKEIDAFYKSIAPNGTIKLDALKPSDRNLDETIIAAALNKKNYENYFLLGYCDEEYEKCELQISDKRNNEYKDYNVKFIFAEENKVVKQKVDAYLDKFKHTTGTVEDNLFILSDLENINYKYTIVKHGREDIDLINSIINYSSEIQNILEYGNISGTLDVRAGWENPFVAGGFGYLHLWYDGIIYSAVDQVGVKQVNILYVSDDTANTRDAYIAAALKRVQDYLPNSKVELKYAGSVNDINDESKSNLEGLINYDNTLGEYYTLTIDGKDFSFLIEKNSSKMKTPKMNTVDLNTNIKVNSNSYEAPLDSKINSTILDKNSKEYKEILSKLKLTDGLSIDINLYSSSTDTYIKKLDNGVFKVYIPLSEEYSNKSLTAYYIKDDGSIETHEVTIEDGYAVFETNHFSTYTLGETPITNPVTSDNIVVWFVLIGISVLGLGLSLVKYKNSKSL